MNTREYNKKFLAKLCEIESGLNNGGGNTSIDLTSIEAALAAILLELQDDQFKSLTPIPTCDGTGVTGYIAHSLDDLTGNLIPFYFLPDGTSTPTEPVGIPCKSPTDFEFKFFEKEICTATGIGKEILCIAYEDGVEVNTETFWIIDGVKVTTDPGVIECVEVCEPLTESFKGDNATITEFNKFTLFIPKCCEVTVTTSAGVITLPAQSTKWVYGESFDCLISGYEVTADCVNNITTILTKTK